MTDSYDIGYSMGLSAALAMTAFVLTKRALKKRRSQERAAASSRGEKLPPRNASYRRLPWIVSIFVGGGTCAAQVPIESEPVHELSTSQPAAAGTEKKKLVASDMAQFRTGFFRGCQRKCVAGGVSPTTCEKTCECSFSELRKIYPQDEALAAWLSSSDGAERERVLTSATTACY
jgi:hypothetical protein